MKTDLSYSRFYEDVHDAWFKISETCVDVSKCHITAEDGIRKIRGLLKPLDRYLESTSSFAPTADRFNYSEKIWKAAYERGKAETLADADVVEVVRCKDCIYADEYHHCGKIKWWNELKDYCSRGERRAEK